MTTTTMERMLPLYEAKMLHQFDHRWATCEGGEVRLVTPQEKADPSFEVVPRYWVDASEVARLTGSTPFLTGWRNIARATDERTTIASSLPVVGVGHSEPLVVAVEAAMLAAILNSYVSDFVARQKVGGTNFTFNLFEQLAVITPGSIEGSWVGGKSARDFINARTAELVHTTWQTAPISSALGFDGPPFHFDPTRRKILRAELDAAFFHLYGIGQDDVDYIMETFPIVKRKDEAEFGEYRTKRLILENYDRMQECMRTGTEFVSALNPAPGYGPRHPERNRDG